MVGLLANVLMDGMGILKITDIKLVCSGIVVGTELIYILILLLRSYNN